ncbi:competence protein CoiA family protein [Sporosarcina sp. YIM B06819]|uniref:competence protein CoiA family protein n=1 Tax=Sporosarcina sp. YIM B06819 TaxID=3081769 RepID=UPI00298C297D|nr:competence protein CoiA family protein [Sporosarcina sp. YIM B06819]
MMFAMHRIDRKMEWINLLLETESIEGLRLSAKKGVFECPYCSVPMSVRAGEKNVHHFAHPKNLTCAKSERADQAYHNYQKQIKHESVRQKVLVGLVKDELETANQDKQQVEMEYGYWWSIWTSTIQIFMCVLEIRSGQLQLFLI